MSEELALQFGEETARFYDLADQTKQYVALVDLNDTAQRLARLEINLATCRRLLAALAGEAQREHNAMSVARNCALCDAIGESIEWLKEHPAPPEGGQGDAHGAD